MEIDSNVKPLSTEMDKCDEIELHPSSPILSVIVVTWNGKRYALECLNSIQRDQTGLDVEVIVVDNGSSDGTPETIRFLFPRVKLIENESNLGFAKANNI